MNKAQQPLGVLDSGVGGLSVVKDLQRLLPYENILYFADSANCPYGTRPAEQIRELAVNTASFLLHQGAKALVVACNTASTASVTYLRELWPHVPIIGMVPAVKPAANMTKTGTIGVLATQATGRAPALLDVIDRFATGLQVLIITPPGLVEAVEAGQADSLATQRLLEQHLQPIIQANADALVLGCTHFPFLRPVLAKLLGDGVQLIDSGEAVARQTQRVLANANLLHPPHIGNLICYTSGDTTVVQPVINKLLNTPNTAVHFAPMSIKLTASL